MSYLNDPREMAIRPESGITLEEDNRVETMYHWGAAVLDLCDMSVEEYMKPSTVIVDGGTTPDEPGGDDSATTTYKLTYKVNGTVYAEQNYLYGETIIAPADPEPEEGYVFRGWNGLPATMPKKSLTVTAIFEEEGGEETGTSVEYQFHYTWMLNASEMSGDNSATTVVNKLLNSGETMSAMTMEAEHIILTVPGDDAYMDIEDDEEEEWIRTHTFSFVIAIPANRTLTVVKQGSEENINMVGGDSERNCGTIQIDGQSYNVYGYCKEDQYIIMEEASAAPLQFFITVE